MNLLVAAGTVCLMLAAFCIGMFWGGGEKPRKPLTASKRIAFCLLAVDGAATLWVLALCTLAVVRGFTGSLPYLTTLIGALQAATAYILGHYFKKSAAENKRGGIVYDSAMKNPTPDA